ncbi:MAG: VWA domain-containing protein [Planctomycetia bacterium]|nr:MAG: VWA domain-containing protein [Planctomycetia bacterium]
MSSHLHLPLTPHWLLWPQPWVWLLALLPVLPPLAWWWLRHPLRQRTFRLPGVSVLAGAAGAWRGRLMGVLPALRVVALAALIVAAARPQRVSESSVTYAEGVAIQFVLDVSSSMGNPDLDRQARRSRLEIAKDVFLRFVNGDGRELAGRPNDLIGVITFARYADHVCPLTLDRDALQKLTQPIATISEQHDRAQREFADLARRTYPANPEALYREMLRRKLLSSEHQPDPGQLQALAGQVGASEADLRAMIGAYARWEQFAREDGTAIGDGLALAVERLRDLRRATGSNTELTIASRVVVLLTDGENNAGNLSPKEAAELAALHGIRVYSVLVGREEADRAGAAGFARATETLREVAELSGGRFFRARDPRSLANIYAEIDRLERTRVEERSFIQMGELAAPFLMAALACLGAQSLLGSTWLRKAH